MYSPRVRRTWFAFTVALVLLAALLPSVAQDDAEAKQRLELMRAAVGRLEADPGELKAKDALAPAATPLLRYSDPTRGMKVEVKSNFLLDAGVWRLGAAGRPTALVTIEIYHAPDKTRILSFEFLSLTDEKFSLKHKTEPVKWDATASGLELKDLPDAPKPAATVAARLTQMRQLARRFSATETYEKETVECRLITQPIDRYESKEQKITDGAIFALANGTNPEIGIVLEVHGDRWRYGVLRLCGAEASVTLDGKVVATYEKFNARGTAGPYHSGSYKIAEQK
jgi:hypothetical protein